MSFLGTFNRCWPYHAFALATRDSAGFVLHARINMQRILESFSEWVKGMYGVLGAGKYGRFV